MDLSSEEDTDSIPKGFVCSPTCGRCLTVKFTTAEGKVFTQSYSEQMKIGEIKEVLAEVFNIPANSLVVRKNSIDVSDDKCLAEFDVGQFRILEFQLFSTKLPQELSTERLYEDYGLPDVITVRVHDSDEEDGYRDVVVEILDRKISKPFLGGYVDRDSGIEYHHGYSQTGPMRPRVPPEDKSHRDTQTYWLRNRLLDTPYSRATQMTSTNIWVPNVNDKILTSKPYETADEREKRLDVEGKVRTIQRYYRTWKMLKIVKIMSAEYRKRMQREQALEQFFLQADSDRKKEELIAKVFPRTKADFSMLFAMVDRWKKAEIQRICNTYSGPAKIAAFYMLLDKEVEMLRAIEHHREQVKKDMKIQKDLDFFKAISSPIQWHKNRKNELLGINKDIFIKMETLEVQEGQHYFEIYKSICDEDVDVEDKLQALLNVKLLLRDHICQMSAELRSLVDRACDLLTKGVNKKHLDMLMKRIQGLLKQHIKVPECSFGVTSRMIRMQEKLMMDNLFYCHRCQKLKSHQSFGLNSELERFTVCITCSWDDRVMEPWFELGPYRFLLRIIRREERLNQSPSSVAFILQERDIHYIVVKIWHGHSAISENADIYNLRLCRWFRDKPWAPWNCVLLTVEEAKLHLKIDKLEEVYTGEFLSRVFNKHELAKTHFRMVLKLEEHFQEFGEIDTKWNEIKKFFDIVTVTSKEKVFLKCH